MGFLTAVARKLLFGPLENSRFSKKSVEMYKSFSVADTSKFGVVMVNGSFK